MVTAHPTVAVCIPVLDEAEELVRTITSIWACGHPRGDLQVLVGVDGPRPAVETAARSAGAEVVVLPENEGSYAARNACLDHLRESVTAVLFTDAGCLVQPGWVDAHLRALRTAAMSGGGVRFSHPPDGPTPAGWVDSRRHLKQQVYVERDRFAATCNLAVRRTVVDTTRFDGSLRTGGDAEFCHRAERAGHALVYTATAVIEHPARSSRRELLAKVRRISRGVERQRHRWEERALPRPRPTRGAYRSAVEAGHDVSLWWGLRACLLDYRCTVIVTRAVKRARASS